MVITLNQRSQESIAKTTGLKVSDIIAMDSEKVDEAIEKKIGRKLTHLKSSDSRLTVRGSVYVFLDRLVSLSSIEKILSKI